MSLLADLKQRKLVQWALAYAAAAFALVQGVDIVATKFGWPDSVERFLIIAAFVGFLVTLLLAWYHGERGAQKVTGTELLLLTLLLAIGGGLLWKFARREPVPAAATTAVASANDDRRSIAVLPFVNMSGDKDNEYFSDGITEEILNTLAQIPSLKVAARTSAFAFKGKDRDLRAVGESLGVATVLEGSVQRSGDEVRITAQLIDTRSGFHLWSEKYDRKLTSIFAVEDEISKAIGDKLQVQFSGGHADVAGNTNDPQAHELYLRGLSLLAARGTGLRDAVVDFGKAVELDPGYAQAWGALAEAEQTAPGYIAEDRIAATARSESAARRALAINPDTPSALVAMAGVYTYRLQWQPAQDTYLRAIALAPGDAEAANQFAQFLFTTGQFDRALVQIDRAQQMDPLSAIIGVVRSGILMAMHRDTDATKQIESVLSAHPDFYPANMTAMHLYVGLRRFSDAERQLRTSAVHFGVDPDAKSVLMRGITEPSARKAALASLRSAPANADIRADQILFCTFYFMLGDRDNAIAQLQAFASEPNASAFGMIWAGTFDSLRDDPRYRAILKKMNLPFHPNPGNDP